MGQYYWSSLLYTYEETFNVGSMADQLLSMYADDVFEISASEYGEEYFVYDRISDTGYEYFDEAFFSRNGKDFKSVMDNALFG